MKGLESMNKNCIKELLNKEYFVYIVFRFITITIFVTAAFFLLNLESVGNIYFVVSLYVVAIFLIIKTDKLKVPKLAKCLNKSPFYIRLFVNFLIYIGLGLLVISAITGFKDMNLVYINIALFLFGSGLYFYICKRNKIFEKKDSDV